MERGAEGIDVSRFGQIFPVNQKAFLEATMVIPIPNAAVRTLEIQHRTRYVYGGEITRSANILRLLPKSDRRQQVRSFTLRIEPEAAPRSFEDPFGNHAMQFESETSHTELVIETSSVVEVRGADPFAFLSNRGPLLFPFAWTQAESNILEPFRSHGIDESPEWAAIAEHAHKVARENGSNVTETLFALNLQIFREFAYSPGRTTPDTPVTEVFQSRSGVCQDFANLFIAFARSLSLPSRYVWGYMLVDKQDASRIEDEATHAWVEVYLPNIGWVGFDPTNGVLVDSRYVVVAHSRSPREAPPLVGYVEPAQTQTLDVSVTVTEVAPTGSRDAEARLASR
jgi:transglutaminase-like putative cysteine protease